MSPEANRWRRPIRFVALVVMAGLTVAGTARNLSVGRTHKGSPDHNDGTVRRRLTGLRPHVVVLRCAAVRT